LILAQPEEQTVMAESVLLVTQPREAHGTHAARRLRRQGLVPAVVYGHKEKVLSVVLPKDELLKALRHGARVVDLQADGKQEKALIREVQYDHLGHEVLHVDFTRVSADERITIQVPIELRGIAPGATAGGLLDQPLHALEVECLALSVPESIRVNINELQIGGVIHIRDLKLPEGVKAMHDPEAIVVHVTAPVAEAEAPVGPAAETAEPEVIGRKAAEAEEGE
jgi:large subunit ribosomal protein L25